MQSSTAAVREGRSLSASTVLQAPTKMVTKKSPKLWHRRNAYVTPLNGPAPLYGEWPLVGFDPLEDFSKLHEYYGQEVKKAREEWLKSRKAEEEQSDGNLIELGWKIKKKPWVKRKWDGAFQGFKRNWISSFLSLHAVCLDTECNRNQSICTIQQTTQMCTLCT